MRGRALAWTTAAAVALVLLAFAVYGYPPPGSDAPSFLASAVDFRLGRGLVNPFYPQMAFADPTGARRHVYYPPLFPLVLSVLMPRPTSQGAFLAVAALRAASVLLSCALLLRVARLAPGRAEGAGTPAVVTLSLIGLATPWLPTLGRPEALATLLVILAALGALRLEGHALTAFLGIMAGLVAAAQPFAALELTLVVGMAWSIREPATAVLVKTAAVAGIGLAVFAAALAASPHGLGETLSGMARAFPHTPWGAPPGEGWWRPWITARTSTFYGPLFAAAALCGAHLLVRRGGVRSRAALGAFALALLACLYLGSLTHHSRRNYNALVLSPLAFGIVVFWYATSQGGQGGRGARFGRAACLACVMATGAGFLGQLAAFPWLLAHGRGLQAARTAWSAVPFPAGAPVVLMGNLWPLSEDYDRMQLLSPALLGDAMRHRPVPVLALGQRPEHRGAPPPLTGFELIHDGFNREWTRRPPLLRYFLAEDYSFAVYRPVPGAAAPAAVSR